MCGGFHNAVGGDILISPDIVENFLRKLYGAEFDYSTEIEPTIWRAVLRVLNEATVEGLAQSELPPTMEEVLGGYWKYTSDYNEKMACKNGSS